MSEFEERADQLSLDQIELSLVDGKIFQHAQQKLLSPGAKLLIGPRGAGKTHIMRHTYAYALKNKSSPLAVYATFNRYLNLEPLLKKSPNALKKFHSWVLARLLLGVYQCLADMGLAFEQLEEQDPLLSLQKLGDLVSLLERAGGDELYEQFGNKLTVDHVIKAVFVALKLTGRNRAVLLLDDAALSLASPYLIAFFEVFRLLKAEKISPKASVYPGSTQYGPTFHASHEVEEVPLWLSVEDADYLQIMGDIADRRLSLVELKSITPETLDLFKYVSFGIPRVFLRLLREYFDTTSGSSQKKVNKIIERQAELIGAEYDSLSLKLPQFSSIISAGRKLFDKAVADVSAAQAADAGLRNIILGIKQQDDRSPLVERMLRFLVEIGLLYPLQAVSHGANRKYDRYVPHFAFLYQQGAFKEGRSVSIKGVAIVMQRPIARHPIRRDLSTLLDEAELSGLRLDLPPCQSCGAKRLNDSQRFCHECGQELVAASLFEECMKLPLEKVPGISQAMIARIHKDTKLRNIGHIYSSQNASSDLQRAYYVGPVRAGDIINKITLTVNEFLS
ncbi:hypothetical protein [Chitinimonas sp. JJ19]|uniref:hypothetical protein n=1 Tax=Chitinimonas sp. JJ19 TaxID=3109352 RepID=UPI00300102F0